MNQPPKMISTKDSGSFNDQLNSLYVLCKKLKDYEESLEDSDLKMTVGRTRTTLTTHYSQLLRCLNG